MRKINVKTWKVDGPNGQQEEDTLVALEGVLRLAAQKDMPQGLDKFKIYTKLAQAFDKAIKSGTLELEEREYKYLTDLIADKIPSQWALNKDIREAIEEFLNAKEE